ncbi:MAG: hypothetical protein J7639_27295 [Paenibacillaceae bacterium]|nr:hypothetical protein [Paenibacillaceae bacterium]
MRAFQQQAEGERYHCRTSQGPTIAAEYPRKQHAERHEHGNIADKVKQAMPRAFVQGGGYFVKRRKVALLDSFHEEARIFQADPQMPPEQLRIDRVHFEQHNLHDHPGVNSQQRPACNLLYRHVLLHRLFLLALAELKLKLKVNNLKKTSGKHKIILKCESQKWFWRLTVSAAFIGPI